MIPSGGIAVVHIQKCWDGASRFFFPQIYRGFGYIAGHGGV